MSDVQDKLYSKVMYCVENSPNIDMYEEMVDVMSVCGPSSGGEVTLRVRYDYVQKSLLVYLNDLNVTRMLTTVMITRIRAAFAGRVKEHIAKMVSVM